MFYIPNGFQHAQIFSKSTLIWLILVLLDDVGWFSTIIIIIMLTDIVNPRSKAKASKRFQT